MPAALRLPEIILIILENVLSSKTDCYEARKLERSTLAAAARVCKVFTAPALIMLWRSIDTLVPLVKLLSVARLVGLDSSDDESDSDDLDYSDAVLVRHLRTRLVNARLISAAPFRLC